MDTLKETTTAADVCKEAADYLDYNNLTAIAHGSALHKKLREFATVQKELEIKYPAWFKFETGFKFIEKGIVKCLFVGNPRYRGNKTIIQGVTVNLDLYQGYLDKYSVTLEVIYQVKNDWRFADIIKEAGCNQAWWDSIEPVEEVCVAFQQVALGTNVCFWCGHSEEEH